MIVAYFFTFTLLPALVRVAHPPGELNPHSPDYLINL